MVGAVRASEAGAVVVDMVNYGVSEFDAAATTGRGFVNSGPAIGDGVVSYSASNNTTT